MEAQREILERLAVAAEYCDDDTGEHAHRVGQIAALLARAVGQSEQEVERIRLAATLHDIGKIGVPDRVFTKAGGLTGREFEIMKSHTTIGAEILKKSKFSVLQLAREIALCHHERWDGAGYPQGVRGDNIPLSARIVSIADTFDAITHDRHYRKARPLNAAVAEMKSQSGRQFDPSLLKRFTVSRRTSVSGSSTSKTTGWDAMPRSHCTSGGRPARGAAGVNPGASACTSHEVRAARSRASAATPSSCIARRRSKSLSQSV